MIFFILRSFFSSGGKKTLHYVSYINQIKINTPLCIEPINEKLKHKIIVVKKI